MYPICTSIVTFPGVSLQEVRLMVQWLPHQSRSKGHKRPELGVRAGLPQGTMFLRFADEG